MALFDLVEAQCAIGNAQAVALKWRPSGDGPQDITYGELAHRAAGCASMFIRLGLRPGAVVGVMTGRRPETVMAALGIWQAGGVYCPLFDDLGPDPLLTRLQLGQVEVLVIDEVAYHRAVLPIRDQALGLHHVVVLGDTIPDGCEDFQAITMSPQPGGTPPDRSRAGMLHFTSGTSAVAADGHKQPKAIRFGATVDQALATTARTAFDLRDGDMIWCTGEPGWVAHTAYALIAPLALGLTTLLDGAPLTPVRCLSILEDEAVTALYTTPTVIRSLMGAGAANVRRFRPKALRVASCGGEPLSADAVDWGARVLGTPFRDSWWQTETGTIILAHPPPEIPRSGSMGRPLPGVALGIAAPTGGFCPPSGEAMGELAVCLQSMPAAESFASGGNVLPSVHDGWHMTGDLVRRDADGFYWFQARVDEVMNVAGRLVGPFEIEAALLSHPAVAEAGVVGVSDTARHQRIVAYVAVNPGFEPGKALGRELLAYAAERLGAELAPAEIQFVANFPRTKSGKIIRKSLGGKNRSDPTEDVG